MPEETQTEPNRLRTTCCIVGGGPAGMMLGYLLARSGVDVVVLEKHGDFLRDFRGDTIHPSTLELMHELGILDEFLKRPHQEARALTGVVGDVPVPVADFTHLPTRCKFIAFMPQWDFLDFLAEHARRYPAFHLHMKHEVTEPDRRGRSRRRGPGDDSPGRSRRGAAPGSPSGRTAGIRPFASRRGAGGRDAGCADRRPLDEAVAPTGRPRPAAGPVRSRPGVRDALPGRLLAVRVRHPQGGIRRDQGARPGGVPRGDRRRSRPS